MPEVGRPQGSSPDCRPLRSTRHAGARQLGEDAVIESMIRKSGYRFSEKIMLHENIYDATYGSVISAMKPLSAAVR